MGLFRRRRPRDENPADPDERSPRLGLKYKDLSLLRALQDNGADLAEPRHVVHYLYAPSPDGAQQVAAAARAQGWTVSVRDPVPALPGQWGVVAERPSAVLSASFVRDSTDYFEALADLYGGEYDGWEAGV